jgi:hypothetical protein
MGPNRVGVSLLSPDEESTSSYRNIVFSSYLEFWAEDKVQELSDINSEYVTIYAQFYVIS